jgi:hypothetical protein
MTKQPLLTIRAYTCEFLEASAYKNFVMDILKSYPGKNILVTNNSTARELLVKNNEYTVVVFYQ